MRQQAKEKHGQAHVDAILNQDQHHPWRKQRQYDFRLTEDEQIRLQQHGFMVSERLRSTNFASIYYKLYSDDLPVYITSDSVLHAWHRSIDAFLVDFELYELIPVLTTTLTKLLETCAAQDVTKSNEEALADVELFVATVQALLLGSSSPLCVASNANRVTKLLEFIQKEQLQMIHLFGFDRLVDFSLFKPRGHYIKAEALERYFRAMMWLGTMNFRVDGSLPSDKAAQVNDLYQLQCACMAVHLLRQANVVNTFKAIHATISTLAGDGIGADSMTPFQLHEIIGDREILATYFGNNADTQLHILQDEIANRGLGTQAIGADPMATSMGGQPSRPPTSFAFLGQQFVWSAFIFSKLTFDQVFHDNHKVARRIPSGVDVAFALFGNDMAGMEIAKRMTASSDGETDFVKFRDGLPYTDNLIAVRHVVDDALAKIDPETTSIPMLWQLALRELSRPSASHAKVFTSETWCKWMMNTQLASFTQLRHDTILYTKQSTTRRTRCEYPAGYVDPYPSFWLKMNQLAKRMLTTINTLNVVTSDKVDTEHYARQRAKTKARQCFERFVRVTQTLWDISMAQTNHQALSDDQIHFLKTMMARISGSGATRFAGWYPGLFYTQREDSGTVDHLVVDDHTDLPSVEHGDPGGVLHMGVGSVNLAMVVVDKTIFAGPVFSHYEFVTPLNQRLTDEEFSAQLPSLTAPSWARESFLVTK